MRKELSDLGVTMILSPISGWISRSPQLIGATTSTGIVFLCSDTAPWVIATMKRLDALSRFQSGWDSHGGHPLRAKSRDLTVQALRSLNKEALPTPNVVLGSGGNVHLEWQFRGKELEVELEGEAVDYVKVSPQGGIEEGKTSDTEDPVGTLADLTEWLIV